MSLVYTTVYYNNLKLDKGTEAERRGCKSLTEHLVIFESAIFSRFAQWGTEAPHTELISHWGAHRPRSSHLLRSAVETVAELCFHYVHLSESYCYLKVCKHKHFSEMGTHSTMFEVV